MNRRATAARGRQLSSDRLWWSPRQVAAEFGVTRETACEWGRSGVIPGAMKLKDSPNASMRFPLASVQTFLDTRPAACA